MNILSYYSPYLPYTFIPIVLVGLFFHFEKYLRKPQARWLWWVSVILFVAAIGWYAGFNNQGWFDFFKGYYHAGLKIIRNPDILYDEYCYGYVNFPLMAYLFAPLSKLPKEIAGTIFFVIGYILLIPLAYLLVKSSHLGGWKKWLVLALLALSGPLDYSIKMGNTTHMIALTLLIGLLLLHRGRGWLTGILFGINGLIKIPLIIPAGYFFIRRQWRVVGGGMLVVGLVVFASLLLIPYSLNQQWMDSCILANAGKPMAAFNNQSIIGVLARELFPESNFFTWVPINPTPDFKVISRIVMGILSLPMAFVIFFKSKVSRSRSEINLEFFIVLTFSLLISPISWTHYFVFIIIPTALYLSGDLGTKPGRWHNLLLGVSLVFLSVPLNLTVSLFERTNQSLFLSIHFFGGLIFYLFLLSIWAHRKLSVQKELSVSNGVIKQAAP